MNHTRPLYANGGESATPAQRRLHLTVRDPRQEGSGQDPAANAAADERRTGREAAGFRPLDRRVSRYIKNVRSRIPPLLQAARPPQERTLTGHLCLPYPLSSHHPACGCQEGSPFTVSAPRARAPHASVHCQGRSLFRPQSHPVVRVVLLSNNPPFDQNNFLERHRVATMELRLTGWRQPVPFQPRG
jgi:hypothetical protein